MGNITTKTEDINALECTFTHFPDEMLTLGLKDVVFHKVSDIPYFVKGKIPDSWNINYINKNRVTYKSPHGDIRCYVSGTLCKRTIRFFCYSDTEDIYSVLVVIFPISLFNSINIDTEDIYSVRTTVRFDHSPNGSPHGSGDDCRWSSISL